MPDQQSMQQNAQQKQYHAIQSTDPTEQAIEYHLGNRKPMRKHRLLPLIKRRADRFRVYQWMLEQGILEETGEGTAKSPKMVRFVDGEQERNEVQKRYLRTIPLAFVEAIKREEWQEFYVQTLTRDHDAEQVLRSLLEAYRSGQITL